MTHIVVIRFSAMGDVAMTVPVLKRLLHTHPDLEVTMVSVKNFQPFFEGIDRLHFFPADLKGAHEGMYGLRKLFKEIVHNKHVDAVADLHNVLRTNVLKFFFRAAGIQVVNIDKGRAEKKLLTRKENKLLEPLKTTPQRYADVF